MKIFNNKSKFSTIVFFLTELGFEFSILLGFWAFGPWTRWWAKKMVLAQLLIQIYFQ